MRLDACGDTNPEIAVYTGGQVNRLTRIAAIDDCFVQFAAQPGVTYRVVVVDPGTGFEFELRARAAPAP